MRLPLALLLAFALSDVAAGADNITNLYVGQSLVVGMALTTTPSVEATNVPASIAVQPQSVAVETNSNASFTVTATGTAPLAYQWRLGGTAIAGATSTAGVYATNNVVIEANGNQYDVIVTNAYGSATSSVATLTVTNGVTGEWTTNFAENFNGAEQLTWTSPEGVNDFAFTPALEGSQSFSIIGNLRYSFAPVSGEVDQIVSFLFSITNAPASQTWLLAASDGVAPIGYVYIRNPDSLTPRLSVTIDGVTQHWTDTALAVNTTNRIWMHITSTNMSVAWALEGAAEPTTGTQFVAFDTTVSTKVNIIILNGLTGMVFDDIKGYHQ